MSCNVMQCNVMYVCIYIYMSPQIERCSGSQRQRFSTIFSPSSKGLLGPHPALHTALKKCSSENDMSIQWPHNSQSHKSHICWLHFGSNWGTSGPRWFWNDQRSGDGLNLKSILQSIWFPTVFCYSLSLQLKRKALDVVREDESDACLT